MTSFEELNRKQSLLNFPSDKRWQNVEGVLLQPRSSDAAPLISIGGRDHTGAEVEFWTDLPNAMYLLSMLAAIQKQTGARVPSVQPPQCGEYDGIA